ncbi:MAG: hypothetical protein DWQ04_31345 [Chloroflexi bacterium]|nr:MAG: hypothetical protein DWQ04_31345 [Chloroflexota bacterium]
MVGLLGMGGVLGRSVAAGRVLGVGVGARWEETAVPHPTKKMAIKKKASSRFHKRNVAYRTS